MQDCKMFWGDRRHSERRIAEYNRDVGVGCFSALLVFLCACVGAQLFAPAARSSLCEVMLADAGSLR